MRYLVFEKGVHDDEYGVVYNGINVSKRPMEWETESRVVGHIMDKFEALGKPEQVGNVVLFVLARDGHIELEDAEYKLLLDLMKGVDWAPTHARRVNKAREFLAGAPTSVPGPRLVEAAVSGQR